jgi:protein SCO1/2
MIRRSLSLIGVALVTLHAFVAQAQSPAPAVGAYRPAPGVPSAAMPPVLREVAFDQHLDAQVPADLAFRDEGGRIVRLGDYFGRRPLVLALVYYDCPMLCTQVLNGLVANLRMLSFDAGREFDVVTVSFDPREKPALAAAKKTAYIERYARPGASGGWHFLTGDAAEIKRLTEAVGFRYVYDEDTAQFAHPAGIMVLTSTGRISHYLFGIDFPARDLRLALITASENRIGSAVDQLLLYCYHYNPATGRYGLLTMRLVRLGGIVTVMAMAAMILMLRRRERRTMNPEPALRTNT